MKKNIIICILLISLKLFGNDLFNSNDFYLKTKELIDKSKIEFNNGNNFDGFQYYELAEDILITVKKYYNDKNFYFDKKIEAENLINIIKTHLDFHINNGVKDIYPKETDEILNNITIIYDYINQTKYDDSFLLSLKTIELFKKLDYLKIKYNIFPRYYKVQTFEKNKDCLWIISKYTFIYNDPLKWVFIFDANKKRITNDHDPNFIYRLKLIEIPSLNGEIRIGVYEPDKKYPIFDPKMKY